MFKYVTEKQDHSILDTICPPIQGEIFIYIL